MNSMLIALVYFTPIRVDLEPAAAVEARIRALVSSLPTVNGQPIRVRFGGDPRGYTVKLTMPDGRYDTWGGPAEGIGVPQ
jgi:hypothetical protein